MPLKKFAPRPGALRVLMDVRIIGATIEQHNDTHQTGRTAVALYRRLPAHTGDEYLRRLLSHDRGNQRLAAIHRGGEICCARATTSAAHGSRKREALPALWR